MKQDVYDCEIYPNLFTATFIPLDSDIVRSFEISERYDERYELLEYIERVERMIGFNNLGFDWLLIKALRENPNITILELYEIADNIINSDERFQHIDWDPAIPQLDLYRLHHFDNPQRRTSLKTLEFNMRMNSIADLPFPPGSIIQPHQIDTVLKYNAHDVLATKLFHGESRDMIALREEMNSEWLNYPDSKIGKQYFIDALREAGIDVYTRNEHGRRIPRQTHYPDGVKLADIILPLISFKSSTLNDMLADTRSQIITDTKGAFNRKFAFGGITISFGLGGIHGSVKWGKYIDGVMLDFDATSFYPRLPVVHRFYPQHLGSKFCDVYDQLFDRRQQYAKGTSENAVLKKALNSVYGDSGNPYSPFHDNAYMLKTTINGQLMLLMLAEMLVNGINNLELIQINTDGVTIRVPDDRYRKDICEINAQWSQLTGMNLEEKQYSHLFIRDVNNYIGETIDGSRKRIGAYEWEREWHQNHSALVVPRGAEAVLFDGADAETFVRIHPDPWDFLMRVKANKGTHFEFDDGSRMKGTVRYYLSTHGSSAVKIMPKTRTRLHATGYSEPIGKRGEWICPECSHIEKTKALIIAHIEACHASKLMLCQEYDGEALDIDVRAYVGAINQLTEKFN